MASGVARQVHGFDRDVAEVPYVTVRETLRVGSGRVAELGQHLLAELSA
jgi:hypothetical protein